MSSRRAGFGLLAAGLVLVGWQLVRDLPWQAGVALGLAVALAGGLLIADAKSTHDEWIGGGGGER